MLNQFEVPVAYSMISVAEQMPDVNPIQKYISYWIAFNNIYVTLTQYAGRGPSLRTNSDGSLRTRVVAKCQLPMVTFPAEKDQIQIAVSRFDFDFKHILVAHPNTAFFVFRTPEWRGQKIKFDGHGQRVNGVINVGRTVNARYPFWSPIEIDRYQRHMDGVASPSDYDQLSEQLVDLLYTIRNNSMHGGKRADNKNDREVAAKALPLLDMIVSYFLVRPY